MKTRAAVIPLAAAAALALAACGSDSGSGSGDAQASADQKRQEAGAKFAQCMRENGVEDFPDPQPDGGFLTQRGPGEGPSRAAEERAQRECEPILREGGAGPLEGGEEDRAEFQEQALAFARCMREHGVDMADPEFGEDGKVTQRNERTPGGIGPDDPRFEEAEEACRGKQPRPPGSGE